MKVKMEIRVTSASSFQSALLTMRKVSSFPLLAAGFLLLVAGGLPGRADDPAMNSAAPISEAQAPSDRDEIVHVLNRITFGPRPGDVEMVQKMGLRNFIEQQLHPETIDDSAVDQELQQLDLLQKSPSDLYALFVDERKLQQEKKQEQAASLAAAGTPVEKPVADAAPAPAPPPRGNMMALLQGPHTTAVITQLEQDKLIRAVDSNRQLQEVLVDFWSNHFNIDMRKGPCRVLKVTDDRDVIRAHLFGKFRDLLEASAKSPAMLFYLDNAENTAPRQLTQLQRDRLAQVMTQNGGNPDVLPAAGKKMGGINENYAREIMELHTLGVDGGYTQQDVQEVARCFTGWTIDRQTGGFRFAPFRHDNGAKVVLGHEIPAGGGIQDGETVLDILCAEPATAHHIAYEMCQRFVSDNPPDSLVNHVASVFTSTGGDLRQVTEAILTSPEFLSPASFHAKIKSPLEFAVSAVRATESSMTPADPGAFNHVRPNIEGAAILGRTKAADRLSAAKRQSLNWHIYELGEPLFACTPPTGYKEISKIWVSPGALIERLNFALALTGQNVADVKFDAHNLLGGADLDNPDAVLERCASALLQGDLSPGTRKVLEQAALPAGGQGKTVDPSKLIALILGSPEFQRK
jgi:uncharacterized protein (DUF1800 family)